MTRYPVLVGLAVHARRGDPHRMWILLWMRAERLLYSSRTRRSEATKASRSESACALLNIQVFGTKRSSLSYRRRGGYGEINLELGVVVIVSLNQLGNATLLY